MMVTLLDRSLIITIYLVPSARSELYFFYIVVRVGHLKCFSVETTFFFTSLSAVVQENNVFYSIIKQGSK